MVRQLRLYAPREIMTRISPPTRFALLIAISLVVGWRPLSGTFELAYLDDQYTHILLVIPVALAMIYLDWQFLARLFKPDVRTGIILLGLAILAGVTQFLLTTSADLHLALGMLALVIWWIGAFVLCFGAQASRALLFPLCFLFLLVPIPQVVLKGIVWRLQQGSALSAAFLFNLVGIPVAQDGVILTIPGLTLEVAKECSSIRSSSMLLVTTLVLAQLYLRSPWRKALIVAIAVPLSVAKNALRIFTIALLGTRVDPAFLHGKLHHNGGIVFFLISLAAVVALLWILRHGERALQPAPALS